MGETTIGELADRGVVEISDGYRTKRDEHGRPGYRILRVADVDDWKISWAGEDFVREEFRRAIGRKLSEPGDVLLTTKGTVGRVAVYPERVEQVVYSPQMCYFRVSDVGALDSRYLAYWLKSSAFSQQASYRAGSTDMAPYISLRDIRTLRLHLPGIDVQRGVSDVLGALDDKIASNEQVVAAASRLAVALAETSPQLVRLSELASPSTVSRKPAEFDEIVAHFSLPAFDAGALPDIVSRDSIKSNKFLLAPPCVLVSKLNPRIPRIWDVLDDAGRMALASTEFVVLVPKSGISCSALWAAVSHPGVSTELQQKVAGTSGSHQRIAPGELFAVEVSDIRALSVERQRALESLGGVIGAARSSMRQLARARDELLPLLMSGKLRVKGAEAVVSNA